MSHPMPGSGPGRRAVLRAGGALASASALGALAAACGRPIAAGDPDSIKVVIAQYTDGTQPYWRKLVAKFEDKHPGKSVKLQIIDWGNLQTQINTMVQTGQLPDIANLNLFADYADAGLLHPAEDVLTPEVYGDFMPAFADNASFEGRQYALPFLATVNGMYYNKAILREAGFDGPPETREEFLDAVDRIKALPGKYVPYGLALGIESGHYEFGTWARANGGGWTANGKWAIDSDRNVETLGFLQDLSRRGYTQPNPGQTNRPDGTWPLFAQGKAAMVYGAFGARAFLDLIEKGDVDYGLAVHPVSHGAAPVAHGIQDYLMAFKKSGNRELIRDFLSFFYRPENYVPYLKAEGLLPTTQSAVDVLKDDRRVGRYVGMTGRARFDPTTRPVWAELLGVMGNDLGKAVSRNSAPEKVLREFQSIAVSGD
ncbi:ABC transporter substrate-binding protein [Streptomyces sp. WAC 06738]|nr:ABC transporter substrate-binding protein [Streptomyces sp. WAC 06738]